MKKILLLLIFFLAILLLGPYLKSSVKKTSAPQISEPSSTATPTPTPDFKQTTTVTVAGKKYRVSWIVVDNPKKIFLYPNYSQKLSARELSKKYSCNALINAGFYDTNSHALGAVISEQKTLSPGMQSALFNGYFFVDMNQKTGISRFLPNEDMRLAVQSGPLLWENGNPQTLNINNDKLSRRMAVLNLKNNKIYFLAIYNMDSPLQGPYLEDVPSILLQFQKEIGITIKNAINLDGGSASAFYDGNNFLSEINPIGSFFCIK